MDWHELSKIKVNDLREMAKEYNVKGTSGMSKDQLVRFLAEKKGIEKPKLVVDNEAEKVKIKARIRELKAARQAALEAKNRQELKKSRRQIHHLKRGIRKMGHLSR